MALTTLSYNVAFANHLSTKKFIFTDTTDYAGQGVTIANVKVTIKVTSPTGIVYNNLGNFSSPDIVPNTSRNNTTTILVPLAGSSPEFGAYVFEISATDTINTINQQKAFTYNFISPGVTLSQDINCFAPLLKSTDSTNYVVSNITPASQFAVSAVSTGSNYIAIAGDKTAVFQGGTIFTISGSTGNNGDYTVVSSLYDKTTDKTRITVSTVPSSTADGIVYVKYNKIFFPQVLGLSPLVGYTATVQTSSFYNKTHEFSVTTTNLYDFGGGIFVIDKPSASTEADIECSVGLCDVYCCIATVRNMWLSSIGTNRTLADIYEKKYVLITSMMSEMRNAFECNEGAAVDTLKSQILKVAECEPGCSCTGTTPTPIVGVGGASNTDIVSAGNGVTVSKTVVGNLTTFTLGITASLLATINSKYNTNLVSSASINVNEVINSDGSKTYTPTFIGTIPTLKDTSSFFTQFQYTNFASPSITITPGTSTIVGPNLKAATITSFDAANPNWANLNNYFIVSGFQNTPNTTYKVYAELIVEQYTDLSTGTVSTGSALKDFARLLEVEILDKQSGQFAFRFVNSMNGAIITNKFMTYYTNILINFLIAE